MRDVTGIAHPAGINGNEHTVFNFLVIAFVFHVFGYTNHAVLVCGGTSSNCSSLIILPIAAVLPNNDSFSLLLITTGVYFACDFIRIGKPTAFCHFQIEHLL